MPDITLPRSNSNNGTATPATPGSITAVAGNLLICVIGAWGTSPTIAIPTSAGTWVQIRNSAGASQSFAMFMQANNAGGAINPSSVLGGAITGWIAAIFEFTQTGANCGLQGSVAQTSSIAQLTNIFPGGGQTLSNELFVYSVMRGNATLTPQNSFQGSLAVWSPSVQPFANVQGLSLDTFWASGLGQGVGQYPTASGLLAGGGLVSNAIAAWFNTTASQPGPNEDNIGGLSGILVGSNYQGMLGG